MASVADVSTTTALMAAMPDEPDAMLLFDAFEQWATTRGLQLYPHQQDAILEVMSGSNVILTTPTGSGKSMVANAAHYFALAQRKKTYYTAPIKALVSEKFFDLVATFGADNVGMMTGDAQVNGDAPIICCTAEVLANAALRLGPDSDVGQVVMDEFHFYTDTQRGWAWQIPLLELPHAQFILMSATLGDVTFFKDELTSVTERPTVNVHGAERPVPLQFDYVKTPMHVTVEQLTERNQSPVYIVHSTQAAALERAQALMSINFCTKEEKAAIGEKLKGFRFRSGFGKTLSRFVRHGIGVHHAGMLPKYRRMVEQLAQAGLLKIVCGTDTLGVGINMPIRTVLLTSLTKFDGKRVRVMKAREFHQIVGRAGRAGYDNVGYVVAQAPDHVIENERMSDKAKDNKKRKTVPKKPPEGFVNWSEQTFEKLINAQPETLVSHFRVTHSMILNVISRPGDAFEAMKYLLLNNHDDPKEQRRHVSRAISIYRELLAAGVIERLAVPDDEGRVVRLTVDLQNNFALNQPLSPFALAAFELLDPESLEFALDVVSVVEATLEEPRQVLFAQESKAKGEAIALAKADGIAYEERMEQLNDISWPKPLKDLLDHALGLYREHHPWVADYELSPKSIVRDMYERAMNFNEYIAFYGLMRSEGLVLRYIADAYRALRQTVPDELKNEDLHDFEAWLGEVVRQTDSSLLDEWEALRNPGAVISEETIDEAELPITANARAFRVMVRNALFRRVELAARRRYDDLASMEELPVVDADKWRLALSAYFEEHDEIGIGADARSAALLMIDESETRKWKVRQIFDDPSEHHDWGFSAEVDLDASDEAGVAEVRVTEVSQL